MQYCDLHTHSNHSDGTYTPTELINEAESIGLSAIALCDHNTVSGVPEFLSAAEGKSVTAVAGVEISTDYGKTELHILGLFIDPKHFGRVEEYVSTLIKNKENSNKQLIERLKKGGYDVDFDEIKAKTPNGRFNRAHIASELTEKGYTESVSDAFATLLSQENEYYVPVKRVDVFDAIEFLESINAISVIAHPFLNLNESELEIFLPKAKEHGLCAMEVFYSTYDEETTQRAVLLAEKYGLLQSGGSDFHGARKPDISLGSGRGKLAIPTTVFETLKSALKK